MIGLVAATLPFGASASADESLTWTNEGRPQFAFYHYIDFGSTTIGTHFTWPTFSPDPALPDVKGADLLLDAPNASENICYEVSTVPPREFPGDNVMDTRIWHVGAEIDPDTGGFRSTYRGLNDDFGGTLYSKVRVYLRPNGRTIFERLVVATFHQGWNGGHFGLLIERKNLSQSNCTSGQSLIPWVTVSGNPPGSEHDQDETFSPNAH